MAPSAALLRTDAPPSYSLLALGFHVGISYRHLLRSPMGYVVAGQELGFSLALACRGLSARLARHGREVVLR